MAWLLGTVVTGALLAWALRGVAPAVVLGHLRRADYWSLIAAVAVATLTFPIRAMRWRLILRDVDGQRLPWRPLWHATAVGFMANNLLPARAGEFARAYAVTRQLPVRFTTAFASIAVERVLDGLTILALLALAIALPSFPLEARVGGTPVAGLATGAALAFGAVLVVALAVVHRPGPSLALLGRLLRATLPARLAERLAQVAEGLVAGLVVLKSPGRFAGVVAWSFGLWLVNAASFWLCFRAFALPVPAEASLLLQGLLGFGVAVPSAPGFFGVFEAVTRETLALYGVDPELGVSYAVGYHLATFAPITLLGLYSLSRVHLRLGELRRAAPAEV